MKVQESAENYLEAILILQHQKGSVRSIDVAHYTGFSKPSISRAVGLLRDNGYVSIDQNGLLCLTDAGRTIAETIYERHTVLTELLTMLGVSPETAAEDACRIEHVISAETFAKQGACAATRRESRQINQTHLRRSVTDRLFLFPDKEVLWRRQPNGFPTACSCIRTTDISSLGRTAYCFLPLPDRAGTRATRPSAAARARSPCCFTAPDLRMTGPELQEGALALFRRSIRDNGVDITALQGDLREITRSSPTAVWTMWCAIPVFRPERGQKTRPRRNAAPPVRMAPARWRTLPWPVPLCCIRAARPRSCSVPSACGRCWKRSPAFVSSLNGSATYTRPRRPSPARCWSNAARAAARKAFRSNRRCLSKARNITKYTKNNFLREYYNE